LAIIELEAPVAAIRGKLGGLIFSENKHAAYVKQWTKPTATATARQSPARNWLTEIAYQWQTLNQAQVDAWDALAASPPELDYNSLGQQYFLSGCQWHKRINLRRLRAGSAIANNAPANSPQSPPATFALTVYETDYGARVDRLLTTAADFSGLRAVLFCAVALSGVVQSYSRSYPWVLDRTILASGNEVITTELETALGHLQAGSKIFGALHKEKLNGIRSTPLLTTTIVLPAP